MSEKIFVTGIDTEIGKTIVSAILVEALEADYWKPIQSGDLHYSDTMKVKELVSNSNSRFFEESYRLKTPASPHYSALLDGIEISIDGIHVPQTSNHLVIEGAGGLMVPINEGGDMILDVVKKTATKVVLVSKNYLGSINHTLSAFEVLKSRGIEIDLLVFNGASNEATEKIIIDVAKPGSVVRIPLLEEVSAQQVREFSLNYKKQLTNEFS